MIRVNLLREHTFEIERPTLAPQINRMGIVLLVFFMLVAVGMVWAWWHLDTKLMVESASLELKQAEVARLQEVKKTADAYESQKRALQRRIDVIDQLWKNQTGPVELLNALIACIPAEPVLWLERVTQKGSAVHIEGFALSVESISDFIRALNDIGHFGTVDLEYFTEQENAVKFSINVTIRSGQAAA